MKNLHVRKGDNVKVLTGKDKGKTGKVLGTDPATHRVLVEGINISTHHVRARKATEQGGLKKIEAPVDSSNVQIVCPSCGEAVRVRHKEIDGKNARVCAKCGASLDVAVNDKADRKAKRVAGRKAKKAAEKAKDEQPAPSAESAPEKEAKKPAAKKAGKAAKDVPVGQGSDGKTD